MKKNIKINRINYKMEKIGIINFDSIRSMCIRNEYYTCGSIKEYENLLFEIIGCDNFVGNQEQIDNKILEIATNIFDHSDISKLIRLYGCDEVALMQNLLFNVTRTVDYIYELQYNEE